MSKIETIKRINTREVGGVGNDEIRWIFEEVGGDDGEPRPWVVGDLNCWCRLEDEEKSRRIDDYLRAEGAMDGECIHIYTEHLRNERDTMSEESKTPLPRTTMDARYLRELADDNDSIAEAVNLAISRAEWNPPEDSEYTDEATYKAARAAHDRRVKKLGSIYDEYKTIVAHCRAALREKQ